MEDLTVARLVAISDAAGETSKVAMEVITDPGTPDTVLIAVNEMLAANLRMVKAIGVYVKDGKAVSPGS